MTSPFQPVGEDCSRDVIKLVIMAVGGQGGGVLSNWIDAVARDQGRVSQMTSVAGVAQRTGATIYYIEIAPEGVDKAVFSLAPAAGDVDILIAAELMEAGRAIQRGFVTPDRTTLIASTHRSLAVSEKIVPGNGVAQQDEVRAAADIAARKLVLGDMESMAVQAGSVISASLLGALAGSGALPFPRGAFEKAIRASGKGVDASLNAFAVGFDAANGDADVSELPNASSETQISGPNALRAEWQTLTDRLVSFPTDVRRMALVGLQKVVSFQDLAYGGQYLDRLEAVLRIDIDASFALSVETAKYLANAMAYDDVIGVADKKTRKSRFDRIQVEMSADDSVLHLTEFMHPRADEIISLLPAQMGERWDKDPKWHRRLTRLFDRGRRVRSDSVIGFGMLYLLAGLRGYRRRTWRHTVETRHIESWLDNIVRTAPQDYALAVQIAASRRLIKGYSDTHARGLSKFARVHEGIDLVRGREDAADWARRLIEAALASETSDPLDGALQTIRSFA